MRLFYYYSPHSHTRTIRHTALILDCLYTPGIDTTNSRSIETETKFPPKSLENAPNSPTRPTVGPAPINAETTTLKWPPTHKNQQDLTYGPYNRYAPTCCFNKSVLTIDHGQNVVNQESLAKPEEVANNNVSNHEFHCLRLGVWTNISTVVLWVGAELFNTFFAALFIVFDHVVVLRHRHSVNDNRTRRTFSRLKGFLWFSGWFNVWDQFVVSFPSHHQLYSLTGQWMNVAMTPRCRCLFVSWHVDERTEAANKNISNHEFYCLKRLTWTNIATQTV